jgi:pimeloyl-ACP methyl ester carboxylesterase
MPSLPRLLSVTTLGGALIASLLALPAASAASPAPAADAAPGAAAASDPARGTITWGDCPEKGFDGFACGVLTVPLDWNDLANPANAEIALTVKRASGKRMGFLTFNPGGPGASGLDSAPSIWGQLPGTVKQRFDWVGWDPRGVGSSQPQLTGCLAVEARATDYEPPATGPVDWQALTEATVAYQGALNAECLALNQNVAPYLGTHYVVRDLEAMRVALGAPRWNFWGMSYGTTVGYRYAREYPDRVRTLILDGSSAPNSTVSSFMGESTWAFAAGQQVFGSLFGRQMAARLQRIIDGLNERTVTVNGQEFTRWDVLPEIFTSISYQQAYPQIRAVIRAVDAALRGDASSDIAKPLRALKKRSEQDASSLLTTAFVNCRDMTGYPTVNQIARAAYVANANQSVYAGLVAIAQGTACSGLPADFTLSYEPLTEPLTLPTPPVVINSLGDTLTEYVGARTMANFMAGSSLITYDSTQHVSYLQTPSTCINNAVTRYLLQRTQPGPLLCPYAPSPPPPPA